MREYVYYCTYSALRVPLFTILSSLAEAVPLSIQQFCIVSICRWIYILLRRLIIAVGVEKDLGRGRGIRCSDTSLQA